MRRFFFVSEPLLEDAEKIMQKLDESSATGPDKVPTKILKRCAQALALPVAMLAQSILATGRWPEAWVKHWIVPLYKKKAVFDPANYRGVHLSAQLSKVTERLIGLQWMHRVPGDLYIGANQFAYSAGRGSRDALAFVVLSWLEGFRRKCRFAMYLSDVSGAFDRVNTSRLAEKCRASAFRKRSSTR